MVVSKDNLHAVEFFPVKYVDQPLQIRFNQKKAKYDHIARTNEGEGWIFRLILVYHNNMACLVFRQELATVRL